MDNNPNASSDKNGEDAAGTALNAREGRARRGEDGHCSFPSSVPYYPYYPPPPPMMWPDPYYCPRGPGHRPPRPPYPPSFYPPYQDFRERRSQPDRLQAGRQSDSFQAAQLENWSQQWNPYQGQSFSSLISKIWFQMCFLVVVVPMSIRN